MTARQPFLTFDRVRMNVFNGPTADRQLFGAPKKKPDTQLGATEASDELSMIIEKRTHPGTDS